MRLFAQTLALLFLPIHCAYATSIMLCKEPSGADALRVSDVVVVATVEVESLKLVSDSWQQTILWRVNESWKGRHYKDSTFTTRTRFSDPENVQKGQVFLLRLRGSEPYEWASCSRSRGLLQDSLEDVYEIYKEFYKMREDGPNNSFKPSPHQGGA